MIRLWLKIFGVLVAANVALLLLLYWAFNWSFEVTFKNYLNDQTEERFQPLTLALIEEYQRRGNWEWVINEHSLWRDLMRQYIIREGEANIPDRQNPPPEPGQAGRPPPPQRPANINEDVLTAHGMNPHIMLFDANNRLVIGNPNAAENIYRFDIKLDGRKIGMLGVRPQSMLQRAMESVMAGHNDDRLLVIVGALVLISSLVAFILATWASLRIFRIKEGTSALVRGNYQHHIEVKGKDALEELASDFNRLAQTLEQNRTAHQRWIASTSHELRTPVTIIQGEIDALKDGIRKPTAEYLDGISSDINRLNLLIDDLHQLSMSDLGALNYQKDEVEFMEFLDDEIERIRKILPEGIRLQWQKRQNGALTVLGDSARLAQMITNLAQNSIRYTDAPGLIDISITRSAQDVLLCWQDSAPGVDARECHRLTEPLYRTEHSRSRKAGGSGLGLAIVQAIVQAHAGTLIAKPSDLGGLMWEIRLPLLHS